MATGPSLRFLRVAPWLALPLLALAFLAAVWASSVFLRGARLDLTEHRQYTLSAGTLRILGKLQSPVALRLYWSEKAAAGQPQFRVYAQRVRELLDELVAHSDGKLTLKVIDPEPFSDAEDEAAGHGLRAVPLPNNGDNLYFGLVGSNGKGADSVMPFIEPSKEAFLEYDLAKLVSTLGESRKPVLALLGDLQTGPGIDPLSGQPTPGWLLDRQLRAFFDVRRLQANPTSIGDDVDLLMLVHPRAPGADTEYAIEQYVLRGGRLLAFVDPDAESDPNGNAVDPTAPNAVRSSSLPTLFKAWGLAYDPDRVVLDAQDALQVQPDPSEPPQRQLSILGLKKANMNQRDVTTADLETIDVSSAGALGLAPSSPLKLEPLLQSSRNARLVESVRVREAASDPSLLSEGFRADEGAPYVLAARFTGRLATAFPDRAGPKHLARSLKPANIIVVADTDLLSDRLWVEKQNFLGQEVANPFANNADFVYNAVDNLVGNDDLIEVRTRPTSSRPFERIDVVRRAAEMQYESKEKQLQAQLESLERKLSDLQPVGPNGETPKLTPAQQRQVTGFQQQRARTRRELRAVQHGLNADIQAIGNRIKAIDILAMPAFVVLVALLIGWRRRLQRADALSP
jgi:ABC-type uncharacterized transport system involved in gliding motility auxiliary subunit